ncbi:NAD(P)/FAD-dependent oxidoreductase [Lewinella sp. IMCC34191]|uniref:NAD(P)/FAD-dependent oxidoreductase n=1 Tax=Lewinella sp. IMCC34191 TaxID=2259172 RepID=UPI000E276730|nr:NAD(P)/FAD-dependent oxidoreductase [Lewinella sp. IMCC34191]
MEHSYEVIIIGGSYAGLSAAMSLGRSLRRVLIIDGGEPCNKPAPATHNFITHDGADPAAVTERARQQVLAYDTVAFVSDKATGLKGSDGDFTVSTVSGESYQAAKILFATGLHDELPDIPGVAECWGKTVIHCPYCHGYEFRGQATGILMNTEHTVHMLQLIRNLTDGVTLFTNGPSVVKKEQVHDCGAQLIEQPIECLVQQDGQLRAVRLLDGSEIGVAALYLHPFLSQKCPLPERIGCELADNGTLVVDEFSMTTVTGIYAAGDCITHMRMVSAATGSGGKAGAMVNHALVMERFGTQHVGA